MVSQALLALSTLFLTLFFTFENLKFGFYLFIAVIPLLHKETFSLVIWDLLPIRLVLAAMGLVAVARFVVWWRQKANLVKVKKFLKDPVLVFLIVLLIVRLISLINTLELVSSLKLLVFYVGIIFFYGFFKFLAERDRYSFLKSATTLYVWVGLITGVLAIFQFLMQEIFGITLGGLWVVSGHWPRVGSTFWDVNHYGGYLITVIPLALASAFMSKNLTWQRWWGLVTVFLSLVLVLTSSRSAWLGIGIALILFLIILWRWGERKKFYTIVISLVIAFLAFFNFISFKQVTLSDYVGAFLHTRIDSSDTHFNLLSASWELLLKYPWIGAGYGSFNEHLRETSVASEFFSKDSRTGDTRIPPHSVWGEVIAETGIPGLTVYGFLILIIVGYSVLALLKNSDRSKQLLQLGFVTAALGIVVSGIFYSYNVEFYWWILFGSYLLSRELLPDLIDFSFFVKKISNLKALPIIILAGSFALLAVIGLNQTHLIDWDEAIYAQVARNISETGHFLTLQWYKGYPWFEKPPFYMWLTAPLISLFGNVSFPARFWSAMAGMGGVIVTYLIGQKLFNRLTGFVSAAMLLSTVHYLYYSRNGTLDVSVTFFIALTIYFFIRARESKRLLDWSLLGVAVGLGVMTKDIIGLLGLGAVVVFSLLDFYWLKNKKPYLASKKNYLFFALCFLIIVLPWHLIMTLKWGRSFWEVYFVGHVLGRAFTDAQGKTQPLLWYLTVIKVSFRIWCLPLLVGLLVLVSKVAKRDWRYLILAVWVSVIFIFFSTSRSKLIWYIVPIYPVLALIAGCALERVTKALEVMYNFISPHILRIAMAVIIFVTSLSYVYVMRDRVYYQDFNLHIYELFKAKDAKFGIDVTTHYTGLADPAVMYLSRGPVRSVTPGNIEEIGSNPETAVFIMPQDLYNKLKKEGFNFSEVVEWGGFSLVEKHKTS